MTAVGRAARPFPRLIVITDLTRCGPAETLRRFARLAEAARPGTVMVQLRDRERPARERLDMGRALVERARATGQLFQVNDRLDLAVLLGADAVHLGEASVETTDARRVVGEGVLITRACHDVVRVSEADSDGVVLSPILESRKGRPALMTTVLQNARQRLNALGASGVRIVALGGVDAARAPECFGAGADAVAVIGAWLTDRVDGLLDGVGIRRT